MKIAILNSDPMDCTYGGVAPIMKNMHPFLARAFDVQYYFIPQKWMKWPGPHRIKILWYLFTRQKKLRQADFILSHIPEGSFIASFTGVPYAHIYHGNANPMDGSRFALGKLFAPVYRMFFRRIEKTASLQYTIGPAFGNVRKMMNPILHDIPARPVSERSGFIFAGRLESQKNIDRIIRGYAKLPLQVQESNDLFIAGAGSYEAPLRKCVSDLSLEDKVHFIGRLSNTALIAEDSRHLLFLMASYFEGMPTAIAEALSVGVPVVTTAAGDIPSVIQDGINGCLLPIDCSDEDFAAAIERALSDIEGLSTRAKETAAMFDSERITQSLIDDILSVLKKDS